MPEQRDGRIAHSQWNEVEMSLDFLRDATKRLNGFVEYLRDNDLLPTSAESPPSPRRSFMQVWNELPEEIRKEAQTVMECVDILSDLIVVVR